MRLEYHAVPDVCGSICQGDMRLTQASLQDRPSERVGQLWGDGHHDRPSIHVHVGLPPYHTHSMCQHPSLRALSVALSCPCVVLPQICGQCGAVGEHHLIGAWLQPHNIGNHVVISFPRQQVYLWGADTLGQWFLGPKPTATLEQPTDSFF
jgi:hypothetical protein